jgi:hypothetical protein
MLVSWRRRSRLGLLREVTGTRCSRRWKDWPTISHNNRLIMVCTLVRRRGCSSSLIFLDLLRLVLHDDTIHFQLHFLESGI